MQCQTRLKAEGQDKSHRKLKGPFQTRGVCLPQYPATGRPCFTSRPLDTPPRGRPCFSSRPPFYPRDRKATSQNLKISKSQNLTISKSQSLKVSKCASSNFQISFFRKVKFSFKFQNFPKVKLWISKFSEHIFLPKSSFEIFEFPKLFCLKRIL